MTKSQKRIDEMNELINKSELTVYEAATVLGLNPKTVYGLLDEMPPALKITRRKTAKSGIFISTASVVSYARNVQLRDVPFK